MKLSKLTIFLGIYIIASASFAQQLWKFGQDLLGKTLVLALIAAAFIGITLALLHRCLRSKIGFFRMALVILACALAYAFSWSQPYMAEKTHVLEYGLLAWLAMRDFSKSKMHMAIKIAAAFLFTASVACLDEGFQKLLPWRVYEIRDMITNGISGLFGIVLFMVAKK